METPREQTTEQLVKLARQLERYLARRRKLRAKLAELDSAILTTRRFLNELTRPFAQESDDDELDRASGPTEQGAG